jgi:hypothetical protein
MLEKIDTNSTKEKDEKDEKEVKQEPKKAYNLLRDYKNKKWYDFWIYSWANPALEVSFPI